MTVEERIKVEALADEIWPVLRGRPGHSSDRLWKLYEALIRVELI